MGWDNGTSGAYALIGPDRVETGLMPLTKVGKDKYIDETEVMRLIKMYEPDICGIEIGQRQPMFGTKGNFANGYGYGVLRTVMRLSGLPYSEVNPRTWQKVIHKDIRNADMSTKDASIEFCRRTFPKVSLVQPRCSNPHDGVADALCIAEYLRRTHGSNIC